LTAYLLPVVSSHGRRKAPRGEDDAAAIAEADSASAMARPGDARVELPSARSKTPTAPPESSKRRPREGATQARRGTLRMREGRSQAVKRRRNHPAPASGASAYASMIALAESASGKRIARPPPAEARPAAKATRFPHPRDAQRAIEPREESCASVVVKSHHGAVFRESSQAGPS